MADLSGFERFVRSRVAARRAVAVLATAGLVLAVAVPAATALNTSSAKVLELTNSHRTANDVKKLVEYPDMTDVAQAWAEKLAASGKLEHNPSYSKQIPSGWTGAGENVAYNCGYSDGASKLFSQWKGSSGHNKNMLNSGFTHIGVGVAKDSSGCTWGVQVFAKYASGSVAQEDLGIAVDPFNLAPAPVVSGKAKAGSTLSATTKAWSPSAKLTYKWYRNGVAISGATSSKYTVKTSDRGAKLTVKVTGKKSGFATTTKASSATYIPKAFKTVPKATITGTAKVGKTLKVKRGTWSPAPAYSYKWYRNGAEISGATKSSYKVTTKDKGKKITVRVYGKKSGYITTYTTSAARTVSK